MSITLFHHPFSRAAGTVWALEEVGVPYELRFVDIMKGEQKSPEILARNPMGKLPVLVDGDTVVTEAAAIALYLGDRYAAGRLAPALDDPSRGTYLRWSFFSPSVVEPGGAAKHGGWDFKPGQVGWGTFEAMLATMTAALQPGPFLLGERFSMADVVFGGTLRYMVRFGMVSSTPEFAAYIERLGQRPALQRADARNEAIRTEHGIGG
ncbi:MAG: glutathione S-transferase family protein [Nannocystaceae bacterium]|jgi:glutathione S-transferase